VPPNVERVYPVFLKLAISEDKSILTAEAKITTPSEGPRVQATDTKKREIFVNGKNPYRWTSTRTTPAYRRDVPL
jgi:hypothetical protein